MPTTLGTIADDLSVAVVPAIGTSVRPANPPAITATALANVAGAVLPVVSGQSYRFIFQGLYRSGTATVGIRLGLTTPAFTAYSARVVISGFAADGTDAEFLGALTTSGDSVVSTATVAINTDYCWRIEGVIIPSAPGNLQLQAAAEAAGTITLKALHGALLPY